MENKTEIIKFKINTVLKGLYLDYCRENNIDMSEDLRQCFIYQCIKRNGIKVPTINKKVEHPKLKDNSITVLIEPTNKVLFEKIVKSANKKVSDIMREFVLSRVQLLNESFEYCKK